MRSFVWIVILAGCAAEPDDCTVIRARVSPVLATVARDTQHPLPPLADFCAAPRTPAEQVRRTCLLASLSDADTVACLVPPSR